MTVLVETRADLTLEAARRVARPVPARLAGLEAVVRGIVPDLAQPRAFGPVAGSIAEALRREVYPS